MIWTAGSGKDLTITVKRNTNNDDCFAHFTGGSLDGKTLTRDTDYTAKEGSTIVTIKSAVLEKLASGEHKVTVNFDDGKVESKVTVRTSSVGTASRTTKRAGAATASGTRTATGVKTATGAKTGDEGPLAWILLMNGACLVLIGIFLLTRKKSAR